MLIEKHARGRKGRAIAAQRKRAAEKLSPADLWAKARALKTTTAVARLWRTEADKPAAARLCLATDRATSALRPASQS